MERLPSFGVCVCVWGGGGGGECRFFFNFIFGKYFCGVLQIYNKFSNNTYTFLSA